MFILFLILYSCDSSSPTSPDSTPQIIFGCDLVSACNYNENLHVADNSQCEFPNGFYDCDGNCTTGVDCEGECGGDAVEDVCGICNGEGEPCDD